MFAMHRAFVGFNKFNIYFNIVVQSELSWILIVQGYVARWHHF